MANRAENPSWWKEKVTYTGLWFRDRGIQVTSVALPLALIISSPFLVAAAGAGIGGYIVDTGTSSFTDPTGRYEKERAQSAGLGVDLIDQTRGSWRWNPLNIRHWNPLRPPYQAQAAL